MWEKPANLIDKEMLVVDAKFVMGRYGAQVRITADLAENDWRVVFHLPYNEYRRSFIDYFRKGGEPFRTRLVKIKNYYAFE